MVSKSCRSRKCKGKEATEAISAYFILLFNNYDIVVVILLVVLSLNKVVLVCQIWRIEIESSCSNTLFETIFFRIVSIKFSQWYSINEKMSLSICIREIGELNDFEWKWVNLKFCNTKVEHGISFSTIFS